MLDPQYYYFPDPDHPALQPHGRAFVALMFAHAKFEARVRQLQGEVTGDPEFGEQPANVWRTNERAQRMAALIREHFGEVPEAEATAEVLERAKQPSHERNLYVHGEWWRLHPETGTVTVRRPIIRDGEEPHVDFTADDLSRVAESLLDLEVELYYQQKAIETLPRLEPGRDQSR